MKTTIIRGDIEMMIAIGALAIVAAFLRVLRVRSGTSLFFISLLLSFYLVGIETGVSLLDTVVIREETFQLFILLVACNLLSSCHRHHLNDLLSTFRKASPSLSLLFSSSLAPFIGTSHQSANLISDISSEPKEKNLALHAWFRLWIWPFWIGLPLLPIFIFLSQLSPTDILKEIWPLGVIWLLAGLFLLRNTSIQTINNKSSKIYLTYLFVISALLNFSLFFNNFSSYLITLSALSLGSLIVVPQARQQAPKILKGIDWVRWLMLASGISAWPWLLGELSTVSGFSLIENIIIRLDQSHLLYVSFLVIPFVFSLISGSPLLAGTLAIPLLNAADNTQAVFLFFSCLLVGTVLSPEYLSRVTNCSSKKIGLGSIYFSLAPPVILTGLALLFLN